MKALQIKCETVGDVGVVKFLDENEMVLMEYEWVGEKIGHTGTLGENYNEMTAIAESIRDLAMKIGE